MDRERKMEGKCEKNTRTRENKQRNWKEIRERK